MTSATRVSAGVEPMAASRRGVPERPRTSGHRAGKILLVEDEADVAEMIRYNLGKEGYEVRVAGTGTDALRQVKEARPDVILLDIMVPQLNGWEICRRLKQDRETQAIPVIMVTGRVEEGVEPEIADVAVDLPRLEADVERRLVAEARRRSRVLLQDDVDLPRLFVAVEELDLPRLPDPAAQTVANGGREPQIEQGRVLECLGDLGDRAARQRQHARHDSAELEELPSADASALELVRELGACGEGRCGRVHGIPSRAKGARRMRGGVASRTDPQSARIVPR